MRRERWSLPAVIIGAVSGLLLVPQPAHARPAATSAVARRSSADACPKPPREVQYSAPGHGKTVALTFDDGPGASTSDIIGVLLAHHVTATFFDLGTNEAGDPALVRAEKRDGFALGDHTWDHADLATLDAAAQAGEIDRERNEQARITGHPSCLFRPPYGTYDATTLRLARQRHMSVWYWSVDTEDWKADGSADQYWVNRIVSRADAGSTQRHPVVLMHNQPAGNPATVRALPRVIHYYRAHGYSFVDLFGNTGRPAISAMSASTGRTAGGYPLVLRGSNFRNVVAVRFGKRAAPAFHVRSPGRIQVTVPAHRPGPVPITVASLDHGTSVAAHFGFVAPPRVSSVTPAHGPASGGTRILIDGKNFVDVTGVRFGTQVVRPTRVIGSRRIRVVTPAHVPARVDVIVRTRYGVTAPHRADRFTFVAAPSRPGG